NGDNIVYARLSGHSWLSVAGNGLLSGTPFSADVGTNNFIVRAMDPGSLSSSATMTINVTAAPSILASVALQGTSLSINWSGGIAPYQVQMSTNLGSPDWQTIVGPTNTTSITLTPSNDAAFYRISGQ